jgi:hypothetical protein
MDIGVLLGLAGLNMLDGNPMFLGPFLQLFTDVFGAIIDPNGPGFSTPFENAVKSPDHTLSGQGKVDLDAEALAVEIIQDAQQPKGTTIH